MNFKYLVVVAENVPLTSSRYYQRHKEYIDVVADDPMKAQEWALKEARLHRKMFSKKTNLIVDRCIKGVETSELASAERFPL